MRNWHNGSLFSRHQLHKTILTPFKVAWQFFVVERSYKFLESIRKADNKEKNLNQPESAKMN